MTGTGLNKADYVVISIILFFTMWFSFFSEALAEAQGRAQADSLKKMKTETMARLLKDGSVVEVNSTMLKAGDHVELRRAIRYPATGASKKERSCWTSP